MSLDFLDLVEARIKRAGCRPTDRQIELGVENHEVIGYYVYFTDLGTRRHGYVAFDSDVATQLEANRQSVLAIIDHEIKSVQRKMRRAIA